MLYFARWKIIAILAVCLAGLIFALPNVLPRSVLDGLPDVVPNDQVRLGLDLQGGAHLLLELDVEEVYLDRLETVRDDVRDVLRGQTPSIGYTALRVADGAVIVRIRDQAEMETALSRIRGLIGTVDTGMAGIGGGPDLEVSVEENTLVRIVMTEAAQEQRAANTVSQAITVLRRRIDALGTLDPTIQRQGSDRILVQVPGLRDVAGLKQIITETAKMTFHLVDVGVSPQDVAAGNVPPSAMVVPSQDGYNQQYVVEKRALVTGESLVDAFPTTDQGGQPAVGFRFDGAGAKKFGDVTSANVGRPFAIVLDGKVISAPVIQSPILGGNGIITGNFTFESANNLAILLRAGALPASLVIVEERTVGPDLGQDSIEAGEVAAVVGFVSVIAFMAIYYARFGVFAALALVVNLVLIVGALSALGATLTLPGIAGIVLTMGMAVDANVLVFERIREELANGKSPVNAIDTGYQRAFGTIIDANVTTLIAAAILFQLGSGPVRGFAVTLGIGIVTSVFTAVMLTRLMVALWVRRARPKTLAI